MLWRDGFADAVAWLHLGFVAFVVVGLAVVILGAMARWHWPRNRAFRLTHLAAIAFVTARCWTPIACPLTTLEQWLRRSPSPPKAPSGALHFAHVGVFRGARPLPFAIGVTGAFAVTVIAYAIYPPKPMPRVNPTAA